MKIMPDEMYAEDYENNGMEGLWETIKSNIISPLWSALKPAIPGVTERLILPPAAPAAPYAPVPRAPEYVEVERPVVPTWIYYVGAGLVALLVLPRLIKR